MTEDIDPDRPASEQFDLTADPDWETLDPDHLHEVARELERVPDAGLSDRSDESLATVVEALKRLESAAEDARKDGFEDELSPRVGDGERIGNIKKRTGKHTYITDTEAAFEAVFESDEDPLSVASVSIGDLRDVLGSGADEFIGESEYSYFQRVD